MAIRRRHQLIGFRNCQRREQIRQYWLEGTPEPYVKEVRQVGVANVVVVRWVGRHNAVRSNGNRTRIFLASRTSHPTEMLQYRLRNQVNGADIVPGRGAEGVRFTEVPRHWQCLPAKRVNYAALCRRRVPSTKRRPPINNLIQCEGEIHRYRLGIRSRARATVAQRTVVVTDTSGDGVLPNEMARFGHQVGEGVQSGQLSRREQIAEGDESILDNVRSPWPVIDLHLGAPLWGGFPSDRIMLRIRPDIHPASIARGDDGHETRAHASRLTLATNVAIGDRYIRHQAAECLPFAHTGASLDGCGIGG